MNLIPIIPEEVSEKVSEVGLRELLARFLVPEGKPIFHRLYGGIRNAVWLAKLPSTEKFVLTVFKPDPEAEERVRRSLSIFLFLRLNNFPVPEVVRTKDGGLYTSEDILGTRRFVSLHRYIYGQKVFPYGRKQILEVGRMMSRLHYVLREFPRCSFFDGGSLNKSPGFIKAVVAGFWTVLHMDLARGNVLFDETGEQITAVLDFEQAVCGLPVIDVAKSLSIISKDNRDLPFEEIRRVLVEGYNSGPENLAGEDQIGFLVKQFSKEIV